MTQRYQLYYLSRFVRVILLGIALSYMAHAQNAILDQFSAVAYNNNDGTQNFSTDWTETSDDNSASTGTILITSNQLRVGSPTGTTSTGVSIQRLANLSSVTTATLSFSISQVNVDSSGDGLVIEASSDGSSYTVLQTFTNTAATTRSYNLTPYLSATTSIRFRVSNTLESGEYFLIDDVRISLSFDYGDAPDTATGTGATNYQTISSDNGAVHQIVSGLALGSLVDQDSGSLQNNPASADDVAVIDDEDAVTVFPHLPTNVTTYSVDVQVTNSSGQDAYLVGYIDRNKNGTFTNGNERSATVVVPSSATNPRTFTMTFSSLSGLSAGTTYMRFRLSHVQAQAETSVGLSYSGEVEDYRIGIGVDYGDAPDVVAGTATGDYQTTSVDGGASHSILTGLSLGSTVDTDNGTQQSITATADATDEDGVTSFPPLLVTDTSYSLNVSVTNSVEVDSYLVGYLDFNRDGDFSDLGERSSTVVVSSSAINPRSFTLNFSGLVGGVIGPSYVRFRLSAVQAQAESSVGMSGSGEVEDYLIEISTLASVSGMVYRDDDLSDSITAGDSGIANIMVTVYRDDGDSTFEPFSDDAPGITAVTDISGNYSVPLAYTGSNWTAVDVTDNDLPFGYLPGERTAQLITLGAGGSSNHDFPFDPPGSLFPFCPAQAFLFQGTPTQAVIVDLVTGTYSYPPGGTMPYQVNGIAYNVMDDFVYGMITSSPDGTMTRVDGSYRATRIGPIPGLPKASIVVGDTDANFHYYVYYSSKIYTIDLDPLSPNFLTAAAIVTPSTSMADWAYNKIDGKLYAIDNGNGDLHRFDPVTGVRETLGYTGIPGSVAQFGAAYNDPSGFLYFSNNTDGIIYRIDARNPASVNPTAVFFSNGPASTSNDGARCLNAPVDIDFGDAPDSYGTLVGTDGARHIVPPLSPLRLGSVIDQENDGQVGVNADGDDTNGSADEDGVSLGGSSLQNQTLTEGTSVTLDITTTGSGVLSAWIDFNRDGDFADTGEQIATDVAPSSGAISLNVTIPASTKTGVSYARFRYSSDTGLSFDGAATDGEVEDYKVNLYVPVDLELTKTVDIAAPERNDIITYTITVMNTGTASATGVKVFDNLPSGLLLIQTAGCTEDLTGIPTCTLGTIAAGVSKNYTIEAQVLNTNPLGLVISNTAEVFAANQADGDSTPNNGLSEDDIDTVDIVVSGLVLEKWLCNISITGTCTYPADFSTSVVGKPGDVMEYRINYTRTGPAIFDVTLLDSIPTSTSLEQNIYGASMDKELTLGCPDGSVVYLEQGIVATITFDLASACVLSTALNPLSSVNEEALLDGEAGYFMFRAKIQ